MSERVRKLQGRITPAATPVAAPGPEYYEYLRVMNADRRRTDREDAEALGNPADLVFDNDPPEPLTEAEETEPEGGFSYLGLLRQLRSEIDDEHPKAGVLDDAIAKEAREQEKASHKAAHFP